MKLRFPCAAAAEADHDADVAPISTPDSGSLAGQEESADCCMADLLPAAGGIMLRLLRRDISLWILTDLIPGGILCGASFLCWRSCRRGRWTDAGSAGTLPGRSPAQSEEAFLALILLILWGMIQIWRKKLTAKTPIAYLPFLWLADGIFVLAGG